MSPERAALESRVRLLIRAGGVGAREARERDDLLLDIAEYQRRHVLPYRRLCEQRGAVSPFTHVDEVPALPTDAFRFARISSRDEHEDVRTFQSSGTTHGERSRHSFADLGLYDEAARTAARRALFPDLERMALVILAPHERELADSSLSYMLARFVEWFGSDASTHVWPLDEHELERLAGRLESAQRAGLPVALLGTSFAFVHALDGLAGRRFTLPTGSRIMQTGGFKGRSRELSPEEMRGALAQAFAIPEAMIVAEYGMTELSSQLYETSLRGALGFAPSAPRALAAPPWLRVTVVDPESSLPQPPGALGLVRIDDPANLDSVSFIQTGDLGSLDEHGLVLHGRASDAVLRGCSITAAQLLSGRS